MPHFLYMCLTFKLSHAANIQNCKFRSSKVSTPICDRVPFPTPMAGPVPAQGRAVARTFTRNCRNETRRDGRRFGPTRSWIACPCAIGLHGRLRLFRYEQLRSTHEWVDFHVRGFTVSAAATFVVRCHGRLQAGMG
jgi:hypothetical protein